MFTSPSLSPSPSSASLLAAAWALALALASGCGGEEPASRGDDGGATPAMTSGPLLPWAAGNSWTYQVTEGAEVSQKVVTIGDSELVGGTGPNKDRTAFKVVTRKKDGTDQTVSWQALEGDRVLRYREQAFAAQTTRLELEEHWSPYKLHVDGTAAHTAAGASWLEEYQETKTPAGAPASTATARDRWTVVAANQSVTVPAGTFAAVVLQKAGGSSAKTYWYARGVGKVKESGDQTEVLVSYHLAPSSTGGVQ